MKRITSPLNIAINKFMFFPKKSSTLCVNKEFFYEKTKPHIITDEEYREALSKTENMETIYFEMSNAEKLIYNNNINIIKQYLSQIK